MLFHESLTILSKAGTGHSTREMFDRYNTIDMDDRKQAINRFQAFLRNGFASVYQNVYQEPVSGQR